jgi:DNA adenine methylase
MKPLLKWAGGKARLAPQIAVALGGSCTGTYYEPFIGSAAVFLHLKSHGLVKRAVLSDANGKLIEAHRAVRDDVDGVLEAIAALPQEDWRERYYEVREAYNAGPWQGSEHAARFFWLNRACFNGLYRENRKGIYNVPIGSYKSLSFPSREAFVAVSQMLQGVELVQASFAEVMEQAGPDDQIYCDPPYVPLSETARFTGYCHSPFGFEQQKELATESRKAALRGAKVVLSNHDLPVVRHELYPKQNGFRYVATPRVARAISRSASSRVRVAEVIATIGPLKDTQAA